MKIALSKLKKIMPKHKRSNKKIGKIGLHQKTCMHQKRQPIEWGKIFADHISKRLVSIIHIKTYNSTIKRQIIQSKRNQSIKIGIFLKKQYKWLICTWKDAQHH